MGWATGVRDWDFVGSKLIELGKIESFKKIKFHNWNMTGKGLNITGATPPIQPRVILLEGDNVSYESLVKDWVETFAGTGGFKFEGLKLSEKFHYSETSQHHGTMLQKLTYQRNQAKEMLNTVQNLKTAIMNIESDLEKLDEQVRAFQDGDWEEIKSIFIDNYGGPQRSWNAIARNVPMVRMAMTWFLRLKVDGKSLPIEKFSKKSISTLTDVGEVSSISKDVKKLKAKLEAGAKDQKKEMLAKIDDLIEEEQMNPAIANYLKRKVQEFWNWVVDYVDWLRRNRSEVQSNLIHQRANLKMYMKWAADHISQAERMKMDPSAIASEIPEFSFKGSPREILKMEYLFHPGGNRPDITEITGKATPVITTTIIAGTTVDVPQKFTEMAFILHFGKVAKSDVRDIKESLESEAGDLLGIMREAGAITNEELKKIFPPDELKEMGYWDEERKEGTDWLSLFGKSIEGITQVLGIEMEKEGLPWTKTQRAVSIAADVAQRGINNFKRSHGLLVME